MIKEDSTDKCKMLKDLVDSMNKTLPMKAIYEDDTYIKRTISGSSFMTDCCKVSFNWRP